MTYNKGANGAGNRAIEAFDKAQRKQLTCGIFYPINIINKYYIICMNEQESNLLSFLIELIQSMYNQ
jgi:hypothetical protein